MQRQTHHGHLLRVQREQPGVHFLAGADELCELQAGRGLVFRDGQGGWPRGEGLWRGIRELCEGLQQCESLQWRVHCLARVSHIRDGL